MPLFRLPPLLAAILPLILMLFITARHMRVSRLRRYDAAALPRLFFVAAATRRCRRRLPLMPT